MSSSMWVTWSWFHLFANSKIFWYIFGFLSRCKSKSDVIVYGGCISSCHGNTITSVLSFLLLVRCREQQHYLFDSKIIKSLDIYQKKRGEYTFMVLFWVFRETQIEFSYFDVVLFLNLQLSLSWSFTLTRWLTFTHAFRFDVTWKFLLSPQSLLERVDHLNYKYHGKKKKLSSIS